MLLCLPARPKKGGDGNWGNIRQGGVIFFLFYKGFPFLSNKKLKKKKKRFPLLEPLT